MKEVILFFPDTKTLADYAARLETGPVEINSFHLTLRARLSKEEIAEAGKAYEAVPCNADLWEVMEERLAACRKQPYRQMNRYV